MAAPISFANRERSNNFVQVSLISRPVNLDLTHLHMMTLLAESDGGGQASYTSASNKNV